MVTHGRSAASGRYSTARTRPRTASRVAADACCRSADLAACRHSGGGCACCPGARSRCHRQPLLPLIATAPVAAQVSAEAPTPTAASAPTDATDPADDAALSQESIDALLKQANFDGPDAIDATAPPRRLPSTNSFSRRISRTALGRIRTARQSKPPVVQAPQLSAGDGRCTGFQHRTAS